MWLSRVLYIGGIVLLGAYYPKYGRYAFYDWLGLAALFSAILTYMVRGRIPKLNRHIVFGGVFLLLGVILTVLDLKDPFPSVMAGGLLIYVLVLWISLPQFLAPDWRYLRTIYGAVSIAAVVTSSYAVGQAYWHFPQLTAVQYWGRQTGLTRHPNELGTFCAMAFPYVLCLASTRSNTGRHVRYIWMGASLVLVLGVALSGSMTGAAVLAVGAMVYLVLTHPGRQFGAVIWVVAVLVVGLTFIAGSRSGRTQYVGQRVDAFLSSNAGKYTLEQRLVADHAALHDIESNPIQGKGMLSEVDTLGGPIIVHNTFLLAWHDGGLFTLVGIVVILYGAVAALWQSWRQVSRTAQARYKPYIAASVAAFVGFLVCMQASPLLYQRSSWFPVAIAFLLTKLARGGDHGSSRLGAVGSRREIRERGP